MKLTQAEETELKRIEEKGALRKGVTTAEFHRSTELRMKKYSTNKFTTYE